MVDAAASTGPIRNLVGYSGQPPKVSWPGDARIAISLVVNYEEGSEPAVGDGDPFSERWLSEVPSPPLRAGKRDLAMETMYEYGARVGFWRLMDIFDELQVKSTFYVCAVALERNLKAAQEIRRRGHDVVCHGYRWEDVTLLSRDEERDHIRRAVASIAQTTGERPLGWYCRYGPSVNTRELVVEEGGFLYDCDAYNDDLPYWTMVGEKRHLVIPLHPCEQRLSDCVRATRHAGRLRRASALHFRSALPGRGHAAEDDVDRAAYALGGSPGPRSSARQVHRLRKGVSQRLVRPQDRDRAPLDGASRMTHVARWIDGRLP